MYKYILINNLFFYPYFFIIFVHKFTTFKENTILKIDMIKEANYLNCIFYIIS